MLDICKCFFNDLNASEIRYCHWKSNVNLNKSLNGKTDLDLLVHSDDSEEFSSFLKKFRFLRILSAPEKQFPGMEDWLGFDHDTGSLVHLHVHYKLILGQKYIKNHHLPLEDIFFENLIMREGVKVPIPELELLILVIRAHMKLDVVALVKQGIKEILSQEYTPFPADIEKEFDSLIDDIDDKIFSHVLQLTQLPIKESVFRHFIDNFKGRCLKLTNILATQRIIMKQLKGFKRNDGLLIWLTYLKLYLLNNSVFNRFLKPSKKKVHGMGKVIAIVGADGSGKSTLVSALSDWLSWKVDVGHVYLGIPKTGFIRLLSLLQRGLNKFKLSNMAAKVETILWLYVAKRRHQISEKARRDALEGNVVISDRYYLDEFKIMAEPMDGPRLRNNSSPAVQRYARNEEEWYGKIKDPDRIFVLQVAFDELRRRKSDLDIETHKIKAAAVLSLNEDSRRVLIDANRPYKEVELDLKRLIWNLL